MKTILFTALLLRENDVYLTLFQPAWMYLSFRISAVSVCSSTVSRVSGKHFVNCPQKSPAKKLIWGDKPTSCFSRRVSRTASQKSVIVPAFAGGLAIFWLLSLLNVRMI
jgi:hypothetical protein